MKTLALLLTALTLSGCITGGYYQIDSGKRVEYGDPRATPGHPNSLLASNSDRQPIEELEPRISNPADAGQGTIDLIDQLSSLPGSQVSARYRDDLRRAVIAARADCLRRGQRLGDFGFSSRNGADYTCE